MGKTVMVFAPHADDAEFAAGGTLARMSSEGDRVILVIASDGSKGTYEYESDLLAAMRASEAEQAAQVLGAEPPVLLGYPDFELDLLPAGVLREQFVRLVRQHRPDIVFSQDAWSPFELHPDHRAVALAAADAISYAMLPRLYPEHIAQGLMPHFVVEKYFYADQLTGANKVVDVSETLERKIAALAEHKTQISFLVEDIWHQARRAGVDPAVLMGEAASDALSAVAWAVRRQAEEVGQAVGFKYGEAFRYQRFHPYVENLLKSTTL